MEVPYKALTQQNMYNHVQTLNLHLWKYRTKHLNPNTMFSRLYWTVLACVFIV